MFLYSRGNLKKIHGRFLDRGDRDLLQIYRTSDSDYRDRQNPRKSLNSLAIDNRELRNLFSDMMGGDRSCWRSYIMPDPGLRKLTAQLSQKLQQDRLLQDTVTQLRSRLNCDRVILYYFYREWQGQVTFESLKAPEFSIFGSTGPDECFNDEYARLYQQGRTRAIADVDTEPIHECHRQFLQSLHIRANLVVPILTPRLWGLLIAHDCTAPHAWSLDDIEFMKTAANKVGKNCLGDDKKAQT